MKLIKNGLVLFGAIVILNACQTSNNAKSIAEFGVIDTTQYKSIDVAIENLTNSSDSIEITSKSTIGAVCEVMGCWMSIETEKHGLVRVTFEGKNVIPKDVIGKSAWVSGVLYKKFIDIETRKHLLQDEGASADEIANVSSDTTEISLIAKGLKIY